MKKIKFSLFFSILTIFSLFAFNGCYTQLAYVDDEADSQVDHSSTITFQEPLIVMVEQPIIIAPSAPVFFPSSTAASTTTTTATEAQSHSPVRESGYRRSTSSQDHQTVEANSGNHTTGIQRSRR